MSCSTQSSDLSQRLMAKDGEKTEKKANVWAGNLRVTFAVVVGIAIGTFAGQFQVSAPKPLSTQLEALLPDCGLPPEFCMEPPAKQVIRKMDAVLITKNGELGWREFKQVMTPFWSDDFEYVTVAFPVTHGLRDWHDNEYLRWNAHFPKAVFTQMIFLGDNSTATTTTYGRVKWTGLFNGIEEPGTPISVRITDFYRMDASTRISYNYMLIDWADVFRQLGRPVLPAAGVPEGFVLPPSAMYGVPAPASQFANPATAAAAKEVVQRILEEDFVHQSTEARNWHTDCIFYGPVGFGLARGVDQYRQHFLAPLKQSLSNTSMELITEVVCEDAFCGAHGWLYGNLVSNLVGLQASGQRVGLRFGMHWRMVDGKAIEGWAILDLPTLFKQLGRDMFQEAAAAVPGAHLAQPAELALRPLI